MGVTNKNKQKQAGIIIFILDGPWSSFLCPNMVILFLF